MMQVPDKPEGSQKSMPQESQGASLLPLTTVPNINKLSFSIVLASSAPSTNMAQLACLARPQMTDPIYTHASTAVPG